MDQDKGAETPALQAPDLCGHACPQCLPGAVAQHPTLKALMQAAGIGKCETCKAHVLPS